MLYQKKKKKKKKIKVIFLFNGISTFVGYLIPNQSL